MNSLTFRNGWVLRVEAPARLHAGLIEICPGEHHCYGGLGVMLDRPSMVVEARIADLWQTDARDPWQARMEAVARQWADIYKASHLPGLQMRVVRSPPAHRGFGTGTQLACSVITLLEAWYAWKRGTLEMNQAMDARSLLEQLERWQQNEAQYLAVTSERGRRSQIGIHGFLDGGWLFDLGADPEPVRLEPWLGEERATNADHASQEQITGQPSKSLPLLNSLPPTVSSSRSNNSPQTQPSMLPASGQRRVLRRPANSLWHAVLAIPAVTAGASGLTEAEYFAACATRPNPERRRMIELITETIGPGLARDDLDAVGPAIHAYGRLAGELFAKVQQGCYRGQAVAKTVEWLRECGATAVSQSSWGPTVFAIVESRQIADDIVARLQHEARLPLLTLETSALANHGAQIQIKGVRPL